MRPEAPQIARQDGVHGRWLDAEGFKDLQIKVDNQQTGIECGDVMAVVTGLVDFPELGFFGVPFDAPVGFSTGGPTCN